jgi:hypothetical protein
LRGALLNAPLRQNNMQQHSFWFASGELRKNETDASSHCSSVQERLVNYGSEALDSTELLRLILADQSKGSHLTEAVRIPESDRLVASSRDQLSGFVFGFRLSGHWDKSDRQNGLLLNCCAVFSQQIKFLIPQRTDRSTYLLDSARSETGPMPPSVFG